VLRRMRRVGSEFGDILFIGEAYLPLSRLESYYQAGIHLPFNFQLIRAKWDPQEIRWVIDTYEGSLAEQNWPNWVLSNHDNARVAARAGTQQAGVAAMLLLTLRGTPVMYYGDELGMAYVPIPAESVCDPWEK